MNKTLSALVRIRYTGSMLYLPWPKRRALSALGTGVLVSMAQGGLACSPNTPSPPAPPTNQPTSVVSAAPPVHTPPAPPAAAPSEASPNKTLAPYAVLSGAPARRILYTWTTSSQVRELSKDPTLLTRSESPEFGSSYFDQRLDERAKQGNAIAQMLRTTPFARARYAWPSPWATFLGFPGENYGHELIQVSLKPEAWIVVFHTSKPEMLVIDMENRPVASADALAHPERIAAVYFEHDDPVTGYAASTAGMLERSAYREYVLINESMIASYAVNTEETQKELLRSADAIDAIAAHLKRHPAKTLLAEMWNITVVKERWPRTDLPQDAQELYEMTLAFPNENYLPAAQPLSALAKQLRELRFSEKPLIHSPTIAFPAKALIKPSPPPNIKTKPKRWGTM